MYWIFAADTSDGLQSPGAFMKASCVIFIKLNYTTLVKVNDNFIYFLENYDSSIGLLTRFDPRLRWDYVVEERDQSTPNACKPIVQQLGVKPSGGTNLYIPNH